MQEVSAMIAVALPWSVGALWCRYALGNSGLSRGWPLCAGLGYILGMVGTGALVYAALRAGLPQPEWFVGGVQAGLGCIALLLLNRNPLDLSAASEPLTMAEKVVMFVVGVGLVVHWWMLAGEATARPLFPWDAWAAWSVKAKIWFELGHYVPVVDFNQWIGSSDPNLRANEAAHYPPMMSLIQLWVAWSIGQWNEPLTLVPWAALPVSVFLICYGTLRAYAARTSAILIAGAIGVLPLFQAHVALAGYADIWLSAGFCASVATLCLYRTTKNPRALWVFLLLTSVLPFIKVEGAVWAVLLFMVLVFVVLPTSIKRLAVLLTVAAVAAWWLFDGFTIPMGGGSALVLRPDLISIPGVDSFELGFSNSAPAFAYLLYLSSSWNLLWYVLPIAWVSAAVGRRNRSLSVLVFSLVSLTLIFLVALFFFTDASAWAQDYTTGNRLVLHCALGLALATAALYFDRPRDS